ncbi:MAG: hypothetical protein PVF27_01780 [Gemmatimonadales bacterium]|jgi:hypothetical protein
MKTRLAIGAAFLACGVVAGAASAQENAVVQRAQQAYEDLNYRDAISTAHRALDRERLNEADQKIAWEILAFSYGALDSAQQAVEAFRELIFLDPDRAPDVEAVAPRITSLYALALAEVLVLRDIEVDSSSFIAGRGSVPITYQVSRPSRVVTRVIGEGIDQVVDTQFVAGSAGIRWQALDEAGEPVPSGDYQVLITAIEGRQEYSAPVSVRVEQGQVDTVAHLTELPGFDPLPEEEPPPRDWRPLGIAGLYAGLTSGAVFALSESDLGDNWRGGVLGISATALIAGVAMSLRQPDPVPVPGNIQYNALLREQLARRNEEIAAENLERRRQVLLTVYPANGNGGGQ